MGSCIFTPVYEFIQSCVYIGMAIHFILWVIIRYGFIMLSKFFHFVHWELFHLPPVPLCHIPTNVGLGCVCVYVCV